MKNLYDLLKKMEARPAMWTGELTLKSIRSFLDGYSLALFDHKIIALNDQSEPNFHNWTANKLGFFESTAGWHNMILAVTIGLEPNHIDWENYDLQVTKEQHHQSILRFYELLEEYINLFKNSQD